MYLIDWTVCGTDRHKNNWYVVERSSLGTVIIISFLFTFVVTDISKDFTYVVFKLERLNISNNKRNNLISSSNFQEGSVLCILSVVCLPPNAA